MMIGEFEENFIKATSANESDPITLNDSIEPQRL